MRLAARWTGVALAGLLFPAPTAAQAVSGWTMDAETGAVLADVEVALLDTLGERRGAAVSDSAGVFTVELPAPGSYVIEASRLGYDTLRTRRLEVAFGEAIQVEVRLGVRALALDPLTVTARRRDASQRARDMREYYERIERYGDRQIGRILTREDLERRAGVNMEWLWTRHFMPLSRCEPTVYWDGRRVDPSMIMDLPATNIEGIELWRGIGAPETRFTDLDGLCGVLLVWSRPLEDNANPFSASRLLMAVGAAAGLFLLIP